MDIRKIIICFAIVTLAVVGTACSRNISDQTERADATQGKDEEPVSESGDAVGHMGGKSEVSDFTPDSTVKEVISDSAFGDFGRLLFPSGPYRIRGCNFRRNLIR